MRDNFDLQGYLRKNNKLLNESFEGFGGYRDLSPLKEDLGESEDSGFSGKIQLSYYDHPSITSSFQKRAVKAFQKWIASEFKGTATVLEDENWLDEITFQLSGLQGVSSIEDVISSYHKMRKAEMGKDFLSSGGPFSILASWMVFNPKKSKIKEDKEDLGGWDGDGKHDQYDGYPDGEFGPEIVNEVSNEDFNDGMEKVIAHIKDGSGKIDGEYVEKTWEAVTGINFAGVKDKVMAGLKKAGMLKSVKEDIDNEADYFDEEDDEEMDISWMEEIDKKKIKDWTCYFEDQQGAISLYSDKFPNVALYATPGWLGANGIVFEAWDEDGKGIDLNPEDPNTNQYVDGKSSYADFESYAEDMEKILPSIESMLSSGEEKEVSEGESKKGYVTDDSDDEKGFVVPGSFHIEDFDDTDLNGSAVEMAIDDLISEFDRIIKKAVPQDLRYSARIFVKKLWASKLRDWKSNM